MKKSKLYKQKYIIAFYDKTDEELLYIFDNAKEILQFQKREINRKNINQINSALYRAFAGNDTHFTTMLTGAVMRVYLINNEEDEDE